MTVIFSQSLGLRVTFTSPCVWTGERVMVTSVRSLFVPLAFGIAAFVLLSCPAFAQSRSDELGVLLKNGQRVSVTYDLGRKFSGRIVTLTADAVTIVNRREQLKVLYSQIVAIDHQRDAVLDGLLIGLAAGVALGWAEARSEDQRSKRNHGNPFCGMGFLDDCSDSSSAGPLIVLGGLGMLVGGSVDALVHRERPIYRSRDSSHVRLLPMVGPRMRGAIFSVSW